MPSRSVLSKTFFSPQPACSAPCFAETRAAVSYSASGLLSCSGQGLVRRRNPGGRVAGVEGIGVDGAPQPITGAGLPRRDLLPLAKDSPRGRQEWASGKKTQPRDFFFLQHPFGGSGCEFTGRSSVGREGVMASENFAGCPA